MNAPFQPDTTSLDLLKVGTKARVVGIDWAALDESEACRLRHFGFDEGVTVEPLHLGPFGRDPMAIRVGRMMVAIRRKHAGAIRVTPTAQNIKAR
jgi:ferrous iron transport protein A